MIKKYSLVCTTVCVFTKLWVRNLSMTNMTLQKLRFVNTKMQQKPMNSNMLKFD